MSWLLVRLPFTSDDPLAVISQHIHAPAVPPSTYNPLIPQALDDLVLRLMNKRPEDRPGSAAEVQAAITDILKKKTLTPGRGQIIASRPVDPRTIDRAGGADCDCPQRMETSIDGRTAPSDFTDQR